MSGHISPTPRPFRRRRRRTPGEELAARRAAEERRDGALGVELAFAAVACLVAAALAFAAGWKVDALCQLWGALR